MEDEYEKSYYEEMSHMMKSSSISFGDLQGEESIVYNENDDVKVDWVLPIIQEDIIYKNFILQLKSKHISEKMEADLVIKNCEYDVGELILLN